MKKASRRKPPQKLVLRGQTLCTLADIDLSNAVGGLDPDNLAGDTGRVDCPGWPTR